MNIALCTLVLNEMEWLPKLYEQHKHWPGLVKWVFVESADVAYMEANPTMVTSRGLSVDGTTGYLAQLSREDSRIVHIPYGFSQHSDLAQGKCEARHQYLNALEVDKPDFFIVLDADEFYCVQDQSRVNRCLAANPQSDAFIFKHRDIWRPGVINQLPLFSYEVTGGFWDIPYCRCWRWYPGLRYLTNHNTPERGNGIGLDAKLHRFDKLSPDYPAFIHMGFACDPAIRAAKNRYYVHRGEGKNDHRQWYVDSRACFETWRPGDVLPKGAKVIEYNGPIPECFQ